MGAAVTSVVGVRREFEDQLHELGEFIRAQREITQLSVRRLADLAGVSNPYLSQIERGLRRPSAEILQQIAKALRISAESLYVRAGILDPEGVDATTVRDAIKRDPQLNAEQKHTLLTVYESFLAEVAAGRAGGSAERSDGSAEGVESALDGER